MRTMVGIAAALALGGCVTQFMGAPKVKNGPVGCKAACEGWGMDLAGMVKMGEYSDGCICQARPGAPAVAPRASSQDASGAPAVAGVWVQMQAAAAAAAQEAAAQRRRMDESAGVSSHPGAPNYVPGH